MVYAEALGQEAMLRLDHVGIPVGGEPGVEAVAWLARAPVPYPVGQDDEHAGGVERLARPEKLAGKHRIDEARAGAPRPMEDEDGVPNGSVRAALGPSQKAVVDAQFRQALAGGKLEIPDHIVRLRRLGVVGGPGGSAKEPGENHRGNEPNRPRARKGPAARPVHRAS